MKSTSTFAGKHIIMLAVLILSFTSNIRAQQTTPKLQFSRPILHSGTGGQQNATYKFSNVTSGVDAYVTIKSLVNGAKLVNIDDTTTGYYNAWQPVIGGPGTTPSVSYIQWEINFETSAGQPYTFPLMDISAIDIDGDNVRVREFMNMYALDSFTIPTVVPTLLKDTLYNDNGTLVNRTLTVNPKNTYLHVLGPVTNNPGIDTLAMDTRINFHFSNTSVIDVNIGAQIDNNGTTGAIATDRYSSLYFQNIDISLNTLPVSYSSFNAYAVNNNTVNLSWVTQNETNNDRFEVERSFDELDFQTVGIIFSAGDNSNTSNSYNFNDKLSDLNGHEVAYYRLKQVDIDGNYTYSAIKVVRLDSGAGSVNNISVQVYPNPYMDNINVNFNSNVGRPAVIRMINSAGQVILSQQTAIMQGNNNIQLNNLSSQISGVYFVDAVIDGKVIFSQKVVKN